MVRMRRSGRTRTVLPLVTSLLVVALAAAGLGYILGLFLTGALGSGPPSDEPARAGAGEPQPGDLRGDPAGPGQGPSEDLEPTGEGSNEPSEPAAADPRPDAAEPDPPEDEPDPGSAGAGAGSTPVSAPAVRLFVVQVGVFTNLDGAEAVLDQLRAAGYDGVVVTDDGYRVWTGLFTDRERGRPLADALAGAGFENFLAEHAVGGSGSLSGDGEEAGVLRSHLEALPARLRRLAAVVESGSGAADLTSELREAEGDLARLAPSPELEDVHESLLRLYAEVRGLLEQAAGGAGADAHPALLAGAAAAAAEAAAVLGSLAR